MKCIKTTQTIQQIINLDGKVGQKLFGLFNLYLLKIPCIYSSIRTFSLKSIYAIFNPFSVAVIISFTISAGNESTRSSV